MIKFIPVSPNPQPLHSEISSQLRNYVFSEEKISLQYQCERVKKTEKTKKKRKNEKTKKKTKRKHENSEHDIYLRNARCVS